jgi:hypothetical protein
MNARIFMLVGDQHRQRIFPMSIDISVDALTTIEKLALMERLWEALSQRPENVPSPEWHGTARTARSHVVRQRPGALFS